MSRPNTIKSFLVRFREIERPVYYAIFWTVLAHALTRGSQVFRELAIASKFGVSERADLVVLLLFIPTFIHQYLIANFPQAGIPIYLDTELKQGSVAARRFHGSVLKFFSLILLGIATVIFLSLLLLPESVLPFQGTLISQTSASKDWLALGLILLLRGLYTLLSLGLLAHRSFVLPALVSCITPLLVSGVLFLSTRPADVSRLLQIFVLGHLIEFLLILVALADEKIRPDFKGEALSPPAMRSLKLHFPLIVGSSLMGLTTFVERWRVGTLTSGELSAFQYSSLIVTLPTVILALPLSQICLTYFSRLKSAGLHGRLAKAAALLGIFSALSGAVIAFGFTEISHYLTRHVYAFGVFKSSDHEMISALVSPFALQIPFYLVGTVLTQALSALRENTWIALGSGMNLIFHFLLSGILIRTAGAKGVALTTSLTYLFSAVLLSVFVTFALRRAQRAS